MKTKRALVQFEPESSCYVVLKQEYEPHSDWVTISSMHFEHRRNARIYADLYESLYLLEACRSPEGD